MKTIEQSAKELSGYTDPRDKYENELFQIGFKAGVKFAQRWISVQKELPIIGEDKYVLAKDVLSNNEEHNVIDVINVSCDDDIDFLKSYTHWRPIEYK